MKEPQQPGQALLEGPGIMLISAAIFGYFGWATSWSTTGTVTGQYLVWVAIFEWTAKILSFAFLGAALLTLALPLTGNLVYCSLGLLGAIAMAVVLAMDLADTQHMVVHPVILVILVGWNGYGSWTGLRNVVRCMRWRARGAQPRPPDGR